MGGYIFPKGISLKVNWSSNLLTLGPQSSTLATTLLYYNSRHYEAIQFIDASIKVSSQENM